MRLLHVSDLHLGAQGDFGQELVLQRLIEDVEVQASIARFDAVVVSGDLTKSGKEDEFARLQDLLIRPIQEKLKISTSQLVAVPGNHDIDRDLVSTYMEPGLQEILTSTEQVDALVSNQSEFSAAMRRLDAWSRFEEALYTDSDTLGISRLARVHTASEWQGALGIVGLNSAWRATGAPNDEDGAHLLISESHLVRALDEIQSAQVRIVVFHHPLHWLADWNHSAIRTELERRNTIVMTGHEHVADQKWTLSGRGSALYLPTACLYQGSRRLPIAYSILDVDPRERTAHLQIRSWKEGQGQFDKATEYLKEGKKSLSLPAEADGQVALLPRYTVVTKSLTDAALVNNSFSELWSEDEPSGLSDIVVEPRLFPAPFTQVAATVVLAQSQDKSLSGLTTVSLGDRLDDTRVGIVSGDALSGVSNALLWLLGERYEKDSTRAPIFLRYRRASGRDPFDRLIRDAAGTFGVHVGRREDPLPRLVVAIDDVDSEDSATLTRLVKHIQSHPENRYILGCHDHHGVAVSAALSRAGVSVDHGYLGPFGLVQLRQLVDKVGGGEASAHIERIMRLVFGEHLPRSPFVLSAVIAVLSANPTMRPRNESRVLEAVIALLLGKFDPSDTEAGIDARGREDLLQELARHFTIAGIDRMDRREAETFVATYFEVRGIEASASPGNHLNALISRRILTQGEDGVGFRHGPFQDVVAASLMRVNPEFAQEMLSDPPRYSAVIRHAAWLGRDDRGLLERVGESTLPSVEGVVDRNVPIFDSLIGKGISEFDDDAIDNLIQLASPASAKEQEQALELHYDFREVSEAAEVQVELPGVTLDAIGATGFLSSVLAGSELVDDVPLKAQLLKAALKGWNAIAEELGSQGHEWLDIRPLFDEIFGDVPSEELLVIWQFFMRTSLVISVSFGTTELLAVSGLGAAIRSFDEDEEILQSPALDFMVTLLWSELKLKGYAKRIRATYDRHSRHLVVSDLLRTLAMAQYLSPHTNQREVSELERFLLDIMASSATGQGSVQRRSSERSKLQTRLRSERGLHRDDAYGSNLVDEILALSEPPTTE